MKPIIITPRLYLRESEPDDAPLAYQLNLDPEVIRYTGDPPFESEDEARTFLAAYDAFQRYGMGRWYVFRKADDEFLGWCGLKYHPETGEADLGYRFLQVHWGKGYATEAGQGCLVYGFNTLGLRRIIARADTGNPASTRVMEKLGMTYHRPYNFDGGKGVEYEIHASSKDKAS
jgi:RimJ/RimL family protein N-acetyltransferase